jgi:nucleoid-associated protein YgaU
MLVGILVLVIVVALVWEKQSTTDLQRMTVDNSGAGNAQQSRGGGLATEVIPSSSNDIHTQPRVSGNAQGRQDNTRQESDVIGAELPLNQQTPVMGPQPPTQQTPTQQGAPPAQTVPRKHKVAKDESLWFIAQKYYGDGTKAELIRQANKDKLQHGDLLKLGMELVIPDLKESRNERPQTQPVEQTTQTQTAGLETAPDGKSYYTVKEGDILGKISEIVYGTSKRAKEILEANKGILADEYSLRPGMKLLIPDAKRK